MKTLISLIFLLSFTLITSAQRTWTSKDSSAVAKLEKSVETYKLKLDKAQEKVDYADSLIQVGSSQVAEGKTAAKQLKADLKAKEKEYATEKKPLLKIANSKNRDEAADAKAEIKTIDTKYKAEIKDLTNQIKANDKALANGSKNLAKGKGYIKTYQKTLKIAKLDYEYYKDELEFKLEEVNGTGEPETGKKGKKK